MAGAEVAAVATAVVEGAVDVVDSPSFLFNNRKCRFLTTLCLRCLHSTLSTLYSSSRKLLFVDAAGVGVVDADAADVVVAASLRKRTGLGKCWVQNWPKRK